jgi:hypothetical protein
MLGLICPFEKNIDTPSDEIYPILAEDPGREPGDECKAKIVIIIQPVPCA